MGAVGVEADCLQERSVPAMESEGLKVVKTYWGTNHTKILTHLWSRDIYKYAFVGHGDKGGNLTDIPRPGLPKRDWIQAGKYTLYGIAEMHLIACHSNDGRIWRANVSKAGVLRTIEGKAGGFSFWSSIVQASGTR